VSGREWPISACSPNYDTPESEEAAAVLHELLQSHPDEVGPAIQYALALEDLGRPYSEAIAALRLATLYGMRSPRFVSVLGGMLFVNGDFTEAEAIFKQADDQNFTFAERSTVHYRPRGQDRSEKALLLEGIVAAVKPGYAFITVSGYPAIFCPGSKFGSLVMERGLRVRFKLGFTVRGPVADAPEALA
jgi:tetratricopeptide (TPR) repeat protein